MPEEVYDLAVVGSAFAGSLIAAIARRLGRTVVLIERDHHPHFAIGESSTPLTNLLLEELTTQYNLPSIRAFSKWGSWQRAHPHVAAGLKRGFSFYHHSFSQPWKRRPERSNELLMAASPNDEVADTHWYRPDFDTFLMQEATLLGADYFDDTELDGFAETAEGVEMTGNRDGERVTFRARFLIDASGSRGFLWKSLQLEEGEFDSIADTEALFTHFKSVARWDSIIADENHPPKRPVVQNGTPAPFPPDDAALHHIFPGGWMWILRFNNGITSAGISVTRELGRALRLEQGSAAWHRMLKYLPSVARQFRDAEPTHKFTHLPRVTFRSPQIVGRSWAMLPSAAGFLDPLLSTGFPLTLLGVQRLASLLSRGPVPSSDSLEFYAAATQADFLVAADLVGALHYNLGRPAIFQALSMLYFAAATFSETTQRLGRARRSPGFLLRGRPDFRQALEELCRHSRRASLSDVEFTREVAKAIEPVNVAGLINSRRRNWYPVDLSDLYSARDKLGVDDTEISEMLLRSGITNPIEEVTPSPDFRA